MADEDRDRELPQRVRGAARSRPTPSAPPPLPGLSEELRQRMQAAVKAERAEAAIQEQEPSTEPRHRETASAGHRGSAVRVPAPKAVNGKRKHTARSGAGVQPERRAEPEQTAKPQPDEKASAEPQPDEKGERSLKPGAVARAELAVQHEYTAKPAAIADEDELTEWLSPAAKSQPATGTEAAPASRRQAAPARKARPVSPSPDAAKKSGRRRPQARVAVRVVIAVLICGALAAAAVRHFARAPGSGPTSAAVARAEAAARNEAATWIARQVSRDSTVACDQVMCAVLTAHGFPSRDMVVLGSTSPDPVNFAVVVETAAVQGLFGSSLATAWAPAVLASFGSGPAAITVRVVAPHGAAAYQTALNADLANRKNAGAGLLNDPQITVPVLAGEQLTAGQVDSRLLLALADLAGHHPISIVQFGNTGPGASVGVPLRFVDLAENVQAAHLARAAYRQAVRAYLSTVNTKFRPATMTTVVLANGQAVLRVVFTAPSPLGMFGLQGSS